MIFSALIALVVSSIAALRWLRVAQREHYIVGSVVQFGSRWWGIRTNWADMGVNRALFVLALIGLFGTLIFSWFYLISFVVVVIGPLGLGIRGTSSKLNWTRRLKTLALVWFLLQLILIVFVAIVLPQSLWSFFLLDLIVIATPVIVDLSLWLTFPLEQAVSKKYVQTAESKLKSISPTIVGITGSFGKTTTKGYLAHLVSGSKQVLATPRSFNTTAGLARSINSQLSSDVEVFIAEMGTYGRGEIAQLCSWVPPDIGIITAIGPVHLERFGTEDKIVKEKSEILERATIAVLNIDDERLSNLAAQVARGKKVITCSALNQNAFVCVKKTQDNLDVYIKGEKVTTFSVPSAAPTNVACAIGAAIELGVTIPAIVKALPTLPVAPNRLTFSTSDRGFSIIDDTYNSNPSGCKAALFVLANTFKDSSRKVVVTPGMIELGSRQEIDNELFARQAVLVADDFIVVGKTNKKALLKGAKAASDEQLDKKSSIRVVKNRAEAVAWVRQNLGPTDVVLYENDLPDHFA